MFLASVCSITFVIPYQPSSSNGKFCQWEVSSGVWHCKLRLSDGEYSLSSGYRWREQFSPWLKSKSNANMGELRRGVCVSVLRLRDKYLRALTILSENVGNFHPGSCKWGNVICKCAVLFRGLQVDLGASLTRPTARVEILHAISD